MALFGGLFGSLGGGGSSSSSTVNLDVQGLNNIGVNETIDLKPVKLTMDETIDLKPVTVNGNIDLKPVKLTMDETIDLKPVEIRPVKLTVDENIDLRPVTLNENIDLKPVAVDTCQTLRLAPLPETRVSSPYHHRVTYGLFGMEIMSVSYNGESGQNIESPHRPQVVEGPVWAGGHRTDDPEGVGENRGIRVRVLHPDEE